MIVACKIGHLMASEPYASRFPVFPRNFLRINGEFAVSSWWCRGYSMCTIDVDDAWNTS